MKIPKAQAVERRARVWELRVQNWTYVDIAKELKINISTVAKILNRITKKYTAQHLEDVSRVKAEQVGQHENIAKEAYEAWIRSKAAAKMLRKKESTNLVGATTNEEIKEFRDQDGDPRYLTAYMTAKEHIRKIVGADAPVKSEVKYSELDNLSDDELREKAREAFDEESASDIEGADSKASGKQKEMESVARASDTSL
jgi:hypothetical protein